MNITPDGYRLLLDPTIILWHDADILADRPRILDGWLSLNQKHNMCCLNIHGS
jgi:hypothetical protein